MIIFITNVYPRAISTQYRVKVFLFKPVAFLILPENVLLRLLSGDKSLNRRVRSVWVLFDDVGREELQYIFLEEIHFSKPQE